MPDAICHTPDEPLGAKKPNALLKFAHHFMKLKTNYPTRLRKSAIHGLGAFAAATIPARKKIGNMSGIIISGKEASDKLKQLDLIKMVELDGGKVLDGSVNGNDLCHVNHSCKPNAFIRVIGNRVEFYALRTIRQGEEITCSYGESYHEGKKRCTCGAKRCKGYL
jgi:hypothetical protein